MNSLNNSHDKTEKKDIPQKSKGVTYPFKRLSVCFDMAGCPNRCKHCWIGVSPNGKRTVDDLLFVAQTFKPFAKKLEVYSWYREPDYLDNYQSLWDLENKLSGYHQKHFELMSFYRAVRDPNYIPWLYSLGVREVQLTLFGMENKTDAYVGRPGAFKEIIKSIDLLLEHQIAPRMQIFVRKDTLDDLENLRSFLDSLNLEQRCQKIGREFHLFVHQGSCDGESAKNYDQWLTPEDLEKIPPYFVKKTLEYFKKKRISAIFGKPEYVLVKNALKDSRTMNLVQERPVFYIDKDFNVYPNISATTKIWHLGNLKTDRIETILENYKNNRSIAQQLVVSTPYSKMVALIGNPQSKRLFTKEDYQLYIFNSFAEHESSIRKPNLSESFTGR